MKNSEKFGESVIRLEEKMDRVLLSIEELKYSQKAFDSRIFKLETQQITWKGQFSMMVAMVSIIALFNKYYLGL